MNVVFFRLRDILWNISQDNHDDSLCKKNCKENRKLFKHNHICQYSLAGQQTKPSKIKALLDKKSFELHTPSPQQRLWNRKNVEDQELAKFDLKVAQFKTMEVEVREGRRTVEDLQRLKIELYEM